MDKTEYKLCYQRHPSAWKAIKDKWKPEINAFNQKRTHRTRLLQPVQWITGFALYGFWKIT